MKIYTVAPQWSASVPRLTPVEADLRFPAPHNHLTFERTNRASSGKGLLLLMLSLVLESWSLERSFAAFFLFKEIKFQRE